jgi:enoyl-CoA hydratase/carnithine racemase
MSEQGKVGGLGYAVDGRIATITLDVPQRGNALSIAMMRAFRAAVQSAEDDASVALIVLRANGKHFCTGADLEWAAARADGEAGRWREGNTALVDLMEALFRLSKPIVARVHGSVFGGAVSLLCLCDDVVAVAHANWRLPELRLGIVPSAIVPALRLVANRSAIRRLLFDDRPWTSVDAQAYGIVTETASEDALDAALQTRIDAWLALPGASFAATKHWLRELDEADFQKALELGRAHAASI